MNPQLIALYVGPDQVMPVMSILATIAGFLMIFWNKVLSLVRRIFGMKQPVQTPPAPDSSAAGNQPPKQP